MGGSLCLQKEQSTLVAAVSARKQRMISFSSGAVMALLSKSLMYTEADDILAAAALAVKEQGGAAAGDGAVQSSAVAPGRCW